MKLINNYIQEKLVINKNSKAKTQYSCSPKTTYELRKIIEERLEKDKNADLNDIDVSNIIDMSELFMGLHPHNIDISKWNVSNVTNMERMFYCCNDFNSDISKWDVSKVNDMRSMFVSCENFDSDLSQWNVHVGTRIESMLYCANSLPKNHRPLFKHI